MNFSTDKGRKRILGSMLPQHVGESVCLLGTLVQLDPNGKMLKMKTSDDHLVTVHLQQPKMKLIKLSPDDPDIFLTEPSADRCSFVTNHFEAFMQMYKSQGSIFWLRFLISYKVHTEEKFCEKSDLAFLMQHFQFIRVLNYIYISIHKRFIEGSNTAVKKLINNLITLTLNSPTHLNLNIDEWLVYLKNSKQLHTTFQNLFGISEPSEFLGFTNFIRSVYTDFFCALCAVFEQWYKADDLSENEFKKVDSKVIYWLPPYDTSEKFRPLCFERYISDYWKEDLQRMLMTDNIHNLFSAHKVAGCCEKFDKEKNIYKVFHFSDRHMMDLMKVFGEKEEGGKCVHTVTEICMKDLCILKPQVMLCTSHESCFVKICHSEKCSEPFICKGDAPCAVTCESKIKNNKKKKQKQNDKFWKTVSVEVFPIDKSKCDASTLAESYDKGIQTYMHLRKSTNFDLPFSMMKSAYQHMAELHHFDFNPRRTECLNRLRKKLSQKHPLTSPQFNPNSLRQPFYRENLFENAVTKLIKLEHQYCSLKGHNPTECNGNCFCRETNTVAVSSSNAFGRVIFLSRISVSIPFSPRSDSPDLKQENCSCKVDAVTNDKKPLDVVKKSNSKKANKVNKDAVQNDKLIESCTNSECNVKVNVETDSEPSKSITDNLTAVSLKEENKNSFINEEEDEYSEVNIDDDIDEICKLIGIDESDSVAESSTNHINNIQGNISNDSTKPSSNEDELVENFLKLIGVKDHSTDEDFISHDSQNSESLDNKAKLKMCAYCKKKEPRRKMFKKCSRCKEDNFPIHHYYCSTECLMEDWAESHEDEHIRFKKQLT